MECKEINDHSIPTCQVLSMQDDRDIQQTRHNLLTSLHIFLSVALISTLIMTHNPGLGIDTEKFLRDIPIVRFIISLVLSGFGYAVTSRYSETGLRVFAWLTIITLAITFVQLGLICSLILVVLNVTTIHDHREKEHLIIGASILFSLVILIHIIIFIVSIIIAKFAFKLSKLIAAKKSTIIIPI